MQLPSLLKKLLTVDDGVLDNQFSLSPAKSSGKAQGDGDSSGEQASPAVGDPTQAGDRDEQDLVVRRPVPMVDLLRQAGEGDHGADVEAAPDDLIPDNLDDVKACIDRIFHLPDNKDIVFRLFTVGTDRPWRGALVFVDGLADKTVINTHILEPLMLLSHITEEDIRRRMQVVAETLVPGNQIGRFTKWKDVVYGILSGSTAVFVDGCDEALIVETKGWEHRTVGLSQTEAVVRGPHDAFTESFRANTGLVRARLRSEHLVTEMFKVGKLATTDVALMYIDGLTNPKLVDEVRRRIKGIDVDYIADSGVLEQFIDDNPRSMLPQTLATERPDRIAHMLSEGHVAIFVGNSPYVLVAPVVLWSLMHSPEDAYLRAPYGTFLRFIRWIALLVALLTPALYVAVTNYHPEMIPTDLLLAIAGSREQVPFPVVAEVLLMEFAIELIREAGIRIPSVIGPTIGIVGALIIGQAAVQAGVVSPLLVIIIAVTALASFTVPNYNMAFGVRLLRFAFLVVAALFGFYGITLALCILLARLSIQKSFGVPFFSPVAPSMDSSPDVLIRGPAYTMNERPSFLQTLNDWRQEPITRPWSSRTRKPLFRKRSKGK